MLNINPFTNPIGLDISDFKIRFMQFRDRSRGRRILQSVGEIAVPQGYIESGFIKNEQGVISTIQALFLQPLFGKPNTKFINASLPEKRIYIKKIIIPDVPENELRGAVSWGIEQSIPVTLDDAYFDWQVLKRFTVNNERKLQILVSVAPRLLVDSYTVVIKKAGFVPVNLENESLAISRALIDPAAQLKGSLLIIDLGKSRTNLMVYEQNTVTYTTSFEISGNEMTKTIAHTMSLSTDEAEKAKIICGLDARKARGKIKQLLEEIINRLVFNINEQLNYYNNYIEGAHAIQTILLTGSVSEMHGLPQYLREQLKMTVLVGDPWSQLAQKQKKNKPHYEVNPFSFTTAIGLALKRFD
ncbi:MAG: type IV pilus assembly protein PilM [Patescibacteria group bacterium]|nr:type IV pilus assembly protein PilM [Patescibacteria group bacterium]MDD5715110.1 type IV pilus assembly protein PilM [Patescibacteria group bacterium]